MDTRQRPEPVAATLRIPALGIELAVELLIDAPAGTAPDVLTEDALAARWGCSLRTVRRLRDRGALSYSRLSERVVVFALADVRALESSQRIAARAPHRARRAGSTR